MVVTDEVAVLDAMAKRLRRLELRGGSGPDYLLSASGRLYVLALEIATENDDEQEQSYCLRQALITGDGDDMRSYLKSRLHDQRDICQLAATQLTYLQARCDESKNPWVGLRPLPFWQLAPQGDLDSIIEDLRDTWPLERMFHIDLGIKTARAASRLADAAVASSYLRGETENFRKALTSAAASREKPTSRLRECREEAEYLGEQYLDYSNILGLWHAFPYLFQDS